MSLRILPPVKDFTAFQEDIAEDFFQKVLDMDHTAVLYGDDSRLSDFSFSGSFTVQDPSRELKALYQDWDNWVLSRIEQVYGLRLDSTKISLPALFEKLEQQRKPVSLH